MIQLPDGELADKAAAGLRELQAEVDAAGSYAERVAEGKRLFELRNKAGNAIFDEVRRTLDQMCAGARRCAYCEDSLADEIEHVRPKDLYPEIVFAWANYIYACGPCNGPKGSHFAVFVADSHVPVEVARKRNAPIVPPLDGEVVLIDPRREDATKLMALDLTDTFLFRPLGAPGSRDRARAVYTIETLRLNVRDALVKARREAFRDYRAHLVHYTHERDAGVSAAQLAELRAVILQRQHPTVWREMQRQHDRLPALRPLFAAVPDAATW
jgi:uncharacterized protein (TIGR02646 family)